MKIFILFIAISTVTGNEYVEGFFTPLFEGERSTELLLKIEEIIRLSEELVNGARTFSPDDRVILRKMGLTMVDFEKSMEERGKLLTELLEDVDESEEEIEAIISMLMEFAEPYGAKLPLHAKEAGTTFVKTVLSDQYLFATRESRLKIMLDACVQIGKKMTEDPRLVKEFKSSDVSQRGYEL